MEALAKAIPFLGTTRTIKSSQTPKVALSQQRSLTGKVPCVGAVAGPSLSLRQPKPLPPRFYAFDWKYCWTKGGKERYKKWHARRRAPLCTAGSKVAQECISKFSEASWWESDAGSALFFSENGKATGANGLKTVSLIS